MHRSVKYLLFVILSFAQTGFCEPVRIGVNTFITGSAAFWGEMSTKGLELALEEENEKGGINGEKVELIYSDFGDLNYNNAVSAAHKFINIDKVSVIFANVAEDVQVIYPIASKAQIPVIAIAVGSETATFGRPGLYRTTSSDLVLWKRSVDHLKSSSITDSCWAVMQSEYFLDMARGLTPYWENLFSTRPYIAEFKIDETDLSGLILKFKQKGCRSVLLMSWVGPAADLIKKSLAIGYNPKFIGPANVSDNRDFLDLVGTKADGLVFGKFNIGTQDFVEKFKKKYGRKPERPAATSYDALKLTAQIMRKYGKTSPAIYKGLEETKNYVGASGTFSFNSNGTRSDENYQLITIKDGVSVPLK